MTTSYRRMTTLGSFSDPLVVEDERGRGRILTSLEDHARRFYEKPAVMAALSQGCVATLGDTGALENIRPHLGLDDAGRFAPVQHQTMWLVLTILHYRSRTSVGALAVDYDTVLLTGVSQQRVERSLTMTSVPLVTAISCGQLPTAT